MSRIIAIGLSAVILVACKPATPTEAATPQASSAPAPAAFDYAAHDALDDRWIQVSDKPTDPIDELDWREVHCNYLAGEMSGDVEIDNQIDARLKELRCFSQDEDALAVKAASAGDPAALARLEVYFARNAG
ncbi:hypothetical protein [Brevundimonas sp.]|uniref:hypothetical protein n=1 Tax=Brevundimonas sp. TaxID=1871086 RepID=UPI003D0C2529